MTPQETNERLFEDAQNGKLYQAKAALAAGADPNARDQWQRTPLHWAAANGHTELARLLIEKGADPTAMDKWQNTPLHWAAAKGHTDIVKLLEEAARDKPGHAGRVAKRRGNDEPQRG
ncbi:MAG TPA: ankyrin repeat domain-containing protein [Gemmataceae bacterium]|nr:ankyrin repeat domain-containing protein [Gemmataceae bacterium]